MTNSLVGIGGVKWVVGWAAWAGEVVICSFAMVERICGIKAMASGELEGSRKEVAAF